MIRKYLISFGSFVLAFAILSVSLLRSSAVTYVFATATPASYVLGTKAPEINYQIPFPGKIGPDSPFWVFKAARDKVWYSLSTSPLKKAELALLFADKRLLSSKSLFEQKKPDIALSTLTKGEKYLEISVEQEGIARSAGYDTSTFLSKLATAALKHRQIMEELMPLVPEDGRPEVVKSEDYSKNAFKAARDALNSKGLPIPLSPFDGQ